MKEIEILRIIYKNLDFEKIEQDSPQLSKKVIENFFIQLSKQFEEKENQFETIYLYSDGGSRGNPGKAAIGAVLLSEDNTVIEKICEFIGVTTNNVAEYTALIKGVERALFYGVKKLHIFVDSELIVKQVKGWYKVKNHKLIPLHRELKTLLEKFEKTEINHIARELNTEADRLVNKALDKHK